MPATSSLQTREWTNPSVSLGVAATTTIYAGTLVARNSSGFAVPAADSAGLVVVGRAEETVVNSGSAGDKSIRVKPGIFGYANSATNAVAADDIGKPAFVEDDITVATAAGTNAIVAGKIIGLADGEVIVDTRFSAPTPTVTDGTTNGAAAAAADLAALRSETELIGDALRSTLAALRTAGIID